MSPKETSKSDNFLDTSQESVDEATQVCSLNYMFALLRLLCSLYAFPEPTLRCKVTFSWLDRLFGTFFRSLNQFWIFPNTYSMSYSAVVWRKVLLVLFMIFELGPYLESLWNGLPSEPIRCGVKEFFHPKKWLWSVWHKKGEKSLRCLNFDLGEKS